MSIHRWAKSRDSNELQIVEALEQLGAWVVRLDTPCDLLVGWRGTNTLLEVKDPKRVARKDQAAQAQWRAGWPGQVAVVTSAAEALVAVGAAVGMESAGVARSLPADGDHSPAGSPGRAGEP